MDFLGEEGGDDAALAEYRDPVGQLEDLINVMADEQDGCSTGPELTDQPDDRLRLGDAERRRRLVEDEQLRVVHGGPSQSNRLSLAAREHANRPANVIDPDVKAGKKPVGF